MVLGILIAFNRKSFYQIAVVVVGVLLCFFLVGCIHSKVETEQEYENSGISTGEFIKPLGWDYKIQRKITPDGRAVDVVWY